MRWTLLTLALMFIGLFISFVVAAAKTQWREMLIALATLTVCFAICMGLGLVYAWAKEEL